MSLLQLNTGAVELKYNDVVDTSNSLKEWAPKILPHEEDECDMTDAVKLTKHVQLLDEFAWSLTPKNEPQSAVALQDMNSSVNSIRSSSSSSSRCLHPDE